MENEIKNKQNRKVTIFALFLSLVSVGVLIFGFLLVSSNKVILLQSLSNIYNKINIFQDNNIPLLDKISDSKNNGIKSLINVKTDKDIFNLSLDYLENANDNKSRLDLAVKYLDDEIINGNIVLEDSKVYFFLKGITEDYYYTNFNYQSFIRSLTTSEYNQIMEYIKDAVVEVVKNDDIKKEKVTVKYNDKDKKVNKLTYRIGYKQLSKMFDNFTKSLKSDKKLYKKIAAYLEISTNELDESLDLISSMIPKDDKKLVEYNVYYYGFNKIFRYDLKLISNDMTLSYQENKDNNTFRFGIADKSLSDLVIKTDGTYEFSIHDIPNLDDYSIKGNYSDNKVTVDYEDKNLSIVRNTSEKDNTFISNNTIILSDENDSVTIDINTTYYFDKQVKFTSTNSKNIDDITEEDTTLLLSNLKDSKIYELISNNEKLSNMLLPGDFLIEE